MSLKRHGGATARLTSKYAKHLLSGAAPIIANKFVDHLMAPIHKKHGGQHHTAGKSSTGDMNKVVYRESKNSAKKAKKVKKFLKKIQKAEQSEFPLIKTVNYYSGQLKSNQGQQFYGVVPMLYTEQLESLEATIMGQSAGSTLENSETFMLIDYRLAGLYSNCGTAVTIMDWYTVIPRTNLNESPTDSWGIGLSQINSGGQLDNNTTAGNGANSYGLTPFQNSYFCQKWKILAERRIVIQPGETMEFRRGFHKQKEIQTSAFNNGAVGATNTRFQYMKGYSMCYFILQYGQPIHDSVTDVVSSAPTGIDIQWSVTMSGSACAATVSTDKPGQRRVIVQTSTTSLANPVVRNEFQPNTEAAPQQV